MEKLMENPDAIAELTRDDHGNVIVVAFKVIRDDDKGYNRCTLSEMVASVLQSEGPEDHSTQVDVEVEFPIS